MELELLDFPVQNVVFGEKTALEGTVLTINREEMARAIDPDGFFADVQIDIARPGEPVRIINIMDVMQPRCKEADEESPYPGMFSPMRLAGTGRTRVLRGVSVMQTGRRQGIQEGIIDMSGPGAAYSLFSSLCNVVLRCTPADPNAGNGDFDAATRKSLLAAALYLGRTARGQQPGSVQTFSTDAPADARLRKVVYIYYLQSQGPLRNTFLYGKDVTSLLPTLLHPNEVLDGAIISGNYIIACQKNPTYLHLNNPVIRELYARHGKTLDFAGVVIANEHSTLFDKRRTAEFAAKLARQVGADSPASKSVFFQSALQVFYILRILCCLLQINLAPGGNLQSVVSHVLCCPAHLLQTQISPLSCKNRYRSCHNHFLLNSTHVFPF